MYTYPLQLLSKKRMELCILSFSSTFRVRPSPSSSVPPCLVNAHLLLPPRSSRRHLAPLPRSPSLPPLSPSYLPHAPTLRTSAIPSICPLFSSPPHSLYHSFESFLPPSPTTEDDVSPKSALSSSSIPPTSSLALAPPTSFHRRRHIPPSRSWRRGRGHTCRQARGRPSVTPPFYPPPPLFPFILLGLLAGPRAFVHRR